MDDEIDQILIYLNRSLDLFELDPADNRYQEGYKAATKTIRDFVESIK